MPRFILGSLSERTLNSILTRSGKYGFGSNSDIKFTYRVYGSVSGISERTDSASIE